MVKVMIVDDDEHIRESLELYLKEKGYHVISASNGRMALSHFRDDQPKIIILDIRLPDMDGLDVLRQIKASNGKAQVAMITAFQDMETTINAMKLGACEYIHKPLDINELEMTIERMKETVSLSEQYGELIEINSEYKVDNIIGKSNVMKEVFKAIGLVSESKTSILIQGESGTGKELVAKVIHNNSPFKNEPFIPINCSALPETLLESELFGHEKGAFTGAVSAKKGKFELAQNGTIFLDEIGEISANVQVKLLRFLQDKEFERLGSEKKILSNARIIAATNRDLSELVRMGKFREDLYFRLKVVTIDIPPLRERKPDIPHLVEYLLTKVNRELHKNVRRLPQGTVDCLLEYDWPGNIRELENVLIRAVLLSKGEVLLEECITGSLKKVLPLVDEKDPKTLSLQEMEGKHILQILHLANWNKGKACEILRISRPTLRHKMKLYKIKHPQERAERSH
jgi:two-component system response regulator AtoC